MLNGNKYSIANKKRGSSSWDLTLTKHFREEKKLTILPKSASSYQLILIKKLLNISRNFPVKNKPYKVVSFTA